MEFTLNYRGILRSNGKPKHKHEIRRVLHKQLLELWKQSPFDEKKERLLGESIEKTCIKREQHYYLPTISERLYLTAEINLTLLRPEPPGKIITQAGDIDNRLKTLFDAFQVPQPGQAVKCKPELDENPLICLVEDDNLITQINVETYQLLENNIDSSEVLLIIKVKICRSRSTTTNIDFA